jgi:hypothetical protein
LWVLDEAHGGRKQVPDFQKWIMYLLLLVYETKYC